MLSPEAGRLRPEYTERIGNTMSRKDLQQTIEQEPLRPGLEANLSRIKEIGGGTSDLLINPVRVSGIPCVLLCCEGMLSTATITELVLHPLMKLHLPDATGPRLLEHINDEMLLSVDRPVPLTFGDVFRTINSGFAVLLADGANHALAFGVQGYDKRGIDEPSSEGNVMGAHEGFTEVVRTNMSLIRRRMKSPVLVQQLFVMGEKSRTDLCLCYMSDRVSPRLLEQIRQDLEHMQLETILSSGYVRPFLERRNWRIFHTTGTTERPDVLCSKLLEGRVALLIDGTPFAIFLPKLFMENFQTLDDYTCKPYYAAFVRWIKYLAFFLALLLPGIYTAIALHHPELLNSTLLQLLTEAEANAPFSLMTESIGVLLMYEVIREAGIRLPKAVGGAVSIVAGLIIGDAAVSSGFISTPLLTVTALSVTTGFVIPELSHEITVFRFLFILCGGLWGLFGISLLGMVMLLNLCATEAYGYPITAPLAPFAPRAIYASIPALFLCNLSKNLLAHLPHKPCGMPPALWRSCMNKIRSIQPESLRLSHYGDSCALCPPCHAGCTHPDRSAPHADRQFYCGGAA